MDVSMDVSMVELSKFGIGFILVVGSFLLTLWLNDWKIESQYKKMCIELRKRAFERVYKEYLKQFDNK